MIPPLVGAFVNPGGLHGFNEGCPLDCRSFLLSLQSTRLVLSSSSLASSSISGVFLSAELADVSAAASPHETWFMFLGAEPEELVRAS